MDDDIFQVVDCKLSVGEKHDVHEALECRWSPMEAEQEDLVLLMV